MSEWTMTIYGSDSKPSATITGFPLKTDVIALTDIESFTVYPLHLHPQPVINSEVTTYINGYMRADKVITLEFSMEDYPIIFPSSVTSLDDFYPMQVINKDYNWINIPSDYYLVPEAIKVNHQNYCMEIVITGIEVSHEADMKKVTLNFKFAYEL